MTSPHIEIDHNDEPIRLFKSDFLEFFTHISPIVVVAIWLPIVLLCLFNSVNLGTASFPVILIGYLSGLFLWTISEYLLHRFLFHFRPRNKWQERAAFLFHGIHHAQPKIKTRLVMPPALAIPLAAIFYGLFYLVFSVFLSAETWTYSTFAGFITGYIFYDLTHYATHHFPMRRGIWKWLKRHHMQHHYKNPDLQFGVSSPLWDYAFTTMPKVKKP
jgi:sterol desaturase/sphingolipid hydroxylase (fatty acid hydroxylase superfamily)